LALAPFRRQVEESGMTDDELGDFFEEVREEVWQEKHGRPNKTSERKLGRDGNWGTETGTQLVCAVQRC